jgi:hypothetical protein
MINCVLLDCSAFEGLYEGALLLGVISIFVLMGLVVLAYIHAGRRLND